MADRMTRVIGQIAALFPEKDAYVLILVDPQGQVEWASSEGPANTKALLQGVLDTWSPEAVETGMVPNHG